MKTFIQFRNEIDGYQDVKKTIEAEEKISVANVHWLIKEAEHLQKYTNVLENVTQQFIINNKIDFDLTTSQVRRKILIVLGGNKGLVGDLWDRIANSVSAQFKIYQKIIIYGKEISQKLSNEIIEQASADIFSFPKSNELAMLQNNLLSMIWSKKFSQVDILWPKMVNLSYFQPTKKNIVPLKLSVRNFSNTVINNSSWPIFEPSKTAIAKALVSRYLSSTISQAVIETKLAESINRATAMEKAKKEVDKIVKQLIHNFRVERKRILTKNQIEVFIAHKVSKQYANQN